MDDEGNVEFIELIELMMIDFFIVVGSELGEVGDFDLLFFGCVSINCGGFGFISKGIFYFFFINVGSGYIEIVFDFIFFNIGIIDYLDDIEA